MLHDEIHEEDIAKEIQGVNTKKKSSNNLTITLFSILFVSMIIIVVVFYLITSEMKKSINKLTEKNSELNQKIQKLESTIKPVVSWFSVENNEKQIEKKFAEANESSWISLNQGYKIAIIEGEEDEISFFAFTEEDPLDLEVFVNVTNITTIQSLGKSLEGTKLFSDIHYYFEQLGKEEKILIQSDDNNDDKISIIIQPNTFI